MNATYVYCLVAAPRRPSIARVPAGLGGTGPVRLLDVPAPGSTRGPWKLWLVVADAPLSRYDEQAINKGLTDLDWVSRAAVAHERVVEAFIGATAVLPMKLFTIFASDDRATAHVLADRSRVARLVKRVAGHRELGVRVTLDRAKAIAAAPARAGTATRSGGAGYLARKKAQHEATSELARRARQTVTDLFETLAPRASEARRRGASELPAQGGALLLDAVFLVRASRESSFRRAVNARARELGRSGYDVTLTGPWPPYSFVGE